MSLKWPEIVLYFLQGVVFLFYFKLRIKNRVVHAIYFLSASPNVNKVAFTKSTFQ